MPAYTFPPDRTDLAVLRIVCRHGFTHDLADLFLRDLERVTADLNAGDGARTGAAGFHH